MHEHEQGRKYSRPFTACAPPNATPGGAPPHPTQDTPGIKAHPRLGALATVPQSRPGTPRMIVVEPGVVEPSDADIQATQQPIQY